MSLKDFVKEIFYCLTISLVLLIILEFIWKGVVLSYFNVNIVLILWVGVAIVLLLIKEEDKP